MSSIKTTQIDGDVSVGRNVAMGGNLKVAGSTTIGHNLKVEGWLDAPNIKGVNKGIFLTVEELREAYPSPQDGWMAGVGASSPFEAYVVKGGEWVATGGTIEINVDMTQNGKDIEQLQQDVIAANTGVTQNANDIATLRTDLSTETAERKTADTTLQSNIDAEAMARQTADAELSQSLSEGNIRFVSFANLDTVLGETYQEIYKAIQAVNGKHTLKYIVTNNESGADIFVGYLDMFADGMRHCLTQEFTTNYLVDADGKIDGGSHNHKLHKYVRYYCLNWSGTDWRGEEWARGTWTKWNSPTEDIESDITTLKTADKSLQTNIDAEFAARKTADENLQEQITVVKNSVGKADGIAPLNADTMVDEAYLPKEVLEISGFVDGVDYVYQSAASIESVVYDTERNTFFGKQNTGTDLKPVYKYYNNWKGRVQYCAEAEGEPYTGKLYVTTDGSYYYDGKTLVCVGKDNAQDVATEKSEREAADANIVNSLNAEATTRQSADKELSTSISNEATERKAQDEALQTSITAINGKFLYMTEAEYNALSTYDETTYYMLTEE